MNVRAILIAALMWVPLTVGAQTAQPTTDDPVANKRAVQLAEELRCLVCQNQTIADSHAELAVDLRRQIREQIAQGRDDRQIIDYMVERYGDFVLYRPPLKATTLLLWFGPAALLIFGLAFLFYQLKARRKRVEAVELTESERREAEALLAGEKAGRKK